MVAALIGLTPGQELVGLIALVYIVYKLFAWFDRRQEEYDEWYRRGGK